MTSSPAKKWAVLFASVVLSVASVAPAFAQSGGSAPAADEAAAATPSAASKAAAKAQRKAARKQARAKKNAELKQLESNGYNPARNDPNYPTDLQNAQKKAAAAAAASQ
ncbi:MULTISPECIES: DUF4148 domain-containing protein [Paraburkholderia]|uniref:DUF4148 domain-containing protein n=1 Tax=Paraburkholderia madseniana TaxID=2599607 RepID=A0A6N6WGT6_9BURK|nr:MULTISPECIES: DUF4148 domain-containing protein [Paraburkholderia]KAE8758994.1 DUF4148 domain-containing protein [Paraburkholderia madseniana]MCX4171319.1 DUF4148 domain-containing protein [Paraburkholderia madseniana]MDQ6459330.1 DUF4148 domain-containing protein [Paraburkholderia madseniana]